MGKYSYIITKKGVVLCGEDGAALVLTSAKDVDDLKELLKELASSEMKGKYNG